MYLIGMVLSIIGIAIGWLPTVGWLGLVLAAAGCVWGALGLSNRKVVSVEIGYSIAGSFMGGVAIPWTLAFQIKHAGHELDSLLLDYPLNELLIVSCGAFFLFWVLVPLGRLKLRPLFFVLALVAMFVAACVGTSAWTVADRSTSDQDIVDSSLLKL